MAKVVTFLARANQGTPYPPAPAGDRKRVRVSIAGDNSYPTGGYAIAPGDVGFSQQIDFLDITNEAITIWTSFWNKTTQKLQFFVMSTGAEVANAVNVSTMSVDAAIEGY